MVRNLVVKLWSSRARLTKLMPVVAMLLIGLFAYYVGRSTRERGGAQDNVNRALDPTQQIAVGDQSQRVVAHIYETIPITREELGEFLIARFGAERLEFLVNRRIVELACKSSGIVVTEAMIEAQLDLDLKALGSHMKRKDFETHVLKRFNKTLYEWKEDVIRPKLMLAQLVKPEIKVTEEDLRKGFEGRYGPRVECRWLIMSDKTPQSQLDKIWQEVSKSEQAFSNYATTINLPDLCSRGGRVPPIHKHFGDDKIEKAAFNLKVGEVSPLIQMPDKMWVILKCDKLIPEDRYKSFDDERLALMQEIEALKLSQRIPEVFADLRKRANPKLHLRADIRQEDLERDVRPEIRGQAPVAPAPEGSRVGGNPSPRTGG